MIRQFLPLFATAAIGGLVFASANAAPVSYTLPDETAAFKPGPNLEVVQNNCTACHSADYINTQPRGPKFKKDFWEACVGVFKDDPHLDEIVKEAFRRRGRPVTEDE